MTSDFPYRALLVTPPDPAARAAPLHPYPAAVDVPSSSRRSQAPVACLRRELREELGVEMASAEGLRDPAAAARRAALGGFTAASIVSAPRARATDTRWWPSRTAYSRRRVRPRSAAARRRGTPPPTAAASGCGRRRRGGSHRRKLRAARLDGAGDRVERDLAHCVSPRPRQRPLVVHRQPRARGRHAPQSPYQRGAPAGAGLAREGPLRIHLGHSGEQHEKHDAPPARALHRE